MGEFGWCFIGAGRLAKQIGDQFLKSGRHRIVSCYTRDPQKGKEFAAKYDATAYEKAEDAIMADGVEGVYVVTTHNAHFRFAKMALELGKPVLCEKAFTVTGEETRKLIKIARKKNVYLCEAMWTWFSPCANKVKQWVEEKAIGKISRADFTYHMKSIDYAPRVSDPKRAGGALLDITVYPITYAYRLFGYPLQIDSRGVIENGIDLGEDVTMYFKDGVTAHISASIADRKGFEKMKIFGDEGKITSLMYHMTNKAVLHKGLFSKKVFKGPGPSINSYLDEFDTVAWEIRNGLKESRMVPLKATADVMSIMDTVREQIGLDYNDLE